MALDCVVFWSGDGKNIKRLKISKIQQILENVYANAENVTGRRLKQVGASPSPNRKTLHNTTVLSAFA